MRSPVPGMGKLGTGRFLFCVLAEPEPELELELKKRRDRLMRWLRGRGGEDLSLLVRHCSNDQLDAGATVEADMMASGRLAARQRELLGATAGGGAKDKESVWTAKGLMRFPRICDPRVQ